jgi:hypothetical protein
VRASSHIGAGQLAFTFACALFALFMAACTGGGGEVGELCVDASDCEEGLQCFDRACRPRCHTHVECGDGYRCASDGECALVTAAIGDHCTREIDCGPGQACILDAADDDLDGILTGSCQAHRPDPIIGTPCDEDSECGTGTCALGHCAQLCGQLDDCPPNGMICATVPRILPGANPRFRACVQGRGVITDEIPMDAPAATIEIPVPSNAVSFAVVSQVEDPDQLVGARRVVGPDGRVLYAEPKTPDEFYTNPIRYQPSLAVSTLLVPNSPTLGLAIGVYQVDVASRFPDGGPGTAVPRVRVLYKVDTSATLDLHFYFLDLADHPCAERMDGGTLDAAGARTSPRFADYLEAIEDAFATAGVRMGAVSFDDVTGHGDMDAIQRDRAGDLFSLAGESIGVNVFLVRSITPAGVQAVVGGTPGPPRTPSTLASGVAVSIEALCYRDWSGLARITAHAIARQMGLFHNRDPQGHPDAIPDSDELPSNLMYFGDRGGLSLSNGQSEVLGRYPGLQ